MVGGDRSTALPLLGCVLTGALLLAGCTDIPEDASVASFCDEGSRFSGSTNWKDGVAAAKKLQETGTPADIDAAARQGFVELVQRMLDSDNGAEFRGKTRHLSAAERKRLVALNAYIAKTCDLS